MTMQQSLNNNTISQPIMNADGPYDILCGRCKAAFNSVGNRRFRVTMSMNLPAYMKAKSKIERSVLVSSIVNHLIEDVGARFLKPCRGSKTQGYVHLTEQQAREKVSHALRDMAVLKRSGAPITNRKAPSTTTIRKKKQQQQQQQQQQEEKKSLPTKVLVESIDWCPNTIELQQRILNSLLTDLEPIPLREVSLARVVSN